jgi:hypothetical protein
MKSLVLIIVEITSEEISLNKTLASVRLNIRGFGGEKLSLPMLISSCRFVIQTNHMAYNFEALSRNAHRNMKKRKVERCK